MKIETGHPATPQAATARQPLPQNASRWLAQLEDAFLGQLGSQPDRGHLRDEPQPAPPPSHDAPRSDDGEIATAHPHGPPAGLAADVGGLGPAAANAALPVAHGAAAPQAPWLPLPAGHPYADLAQGIEPHASPQQAGGGVAATRSPGPRALSPAAPEPPARDNAAPAPRYGRQFMQVSLGDAPEASVRDATLDVQAGDVVAHAVAARLRDEGVALARVFVNGRRIDLAARDRADFPHPPSSNQDLE